ncbi:hypothetical protein N9C31_02280 [Gammaproteobacteria bacterium]|nr:hypothetical protein [Gammaproteobacteria bacterium]
MNKAALGIGCVLMLTGCSQSDQFAASVMGGALIGGVIAEDQPVVGMMIGGALGGIVSKSQMKNISGNVDYRYRQIIETGRTHQRYPINNVYGGYDMVVYPGYGFHKVIRGYRYECRAMKVYVYDGPRVHHKNLTYCRSERGWVQI